MLNQFEDTVENIKPIKLPIKKKSLGTLLDQLENDSHKCYYCDKEFIKRKFLQLHRKKHIDEDGNYPCRYNFVHSFYAQIFKTT